MSKPEQWYDYRVERRGDSLVVTILGPKGTEVNRQILPWRGRRSERRATKRVRDAVNRRNEDLATSRALRRAMEPRSRG